MTANAKRGGEGIEANGLTAGYAGVIVHDFWSSYFKYEDCQHAMCNAHLLRELRLVTENTKETWAEKMGDLLREMKRAKEECQEAGKTELPGKLAEKFAYEYEVIATLGDSEAPYERGERKQAKSRNLLERFIDRKDEIMLFARNFAVPFDNNLAERDIRNVKVKQKVSGAFRSDAGIENFAKISSIVGTASKQKLSVFDTIKGIISGAVSSLFSKDSNTAALAGDTAICE